MSLKEVARVNLKFSALFYLANKSAKYLKINTSRCPFKRDQFGCLRQHLYISIDIVMVMMLVIRSLA